MPDRPTELSLFDELHPDALLPPAAPTVVYDKPNRRQGHLLLAGERGDITFLHLGDTVLLGPCAGPTVDLTAEQLRQVGDYCHRMAERIENR